MKKTAIITGVTGQDGSYLAELLLKKNYKVIGLKRRTSIICTNRIDHLYNNENFILDYYNFSDSTSPTKLILKYKPQEIYNLGAQSHVKVSFELPEEALMTIGNGTLRWL